MSAPIIHGKGRIMFTGFEYAIVPVGKVKPIPGGPALDEDFIKEGIKLLEDNPDFGFPYIVTVYDWLEDVYWIIEGRHRHASYAAAHKGRITILVGHGMRVLDKV
jgi:hypothetical protein